MLFSESYNYVGWIPCLNGQLVFDLVECGLSNGSSYPIKIIHQEINKEKNLTEYIVLSSTVNWKDFGGEDVNGLWTVILFSERMLCSKNHIGTIYLISKNNSSSKKLLNYLESLQLISYSLKNEYDKIFHENFLVKREEINEISKSINHCYKADFKIEENGLVWIDAKDNQNNQNNVGKIIARQSYYYMKYSWHKHQHHNDRAETLTTIHSINKNVFSYEKKIADALIGDLKRNLVRFKRELNPTSYCDILKSKGIINYAKALVEVMKSKNFINQSCYEREQKHLGYFQDSLDVSYSIIEKNISNYESAIINARTVILFLFAIVTPAIAVNSNSIKKLINDLQPTNNIPSYINFIVNCYSSNDNFIKSISFIVFFLLSIFFISYKYRNLFIIFHKIKNFIIDITYDKKPNSFFSNSSLIFYVALIMSLFFILYGLNNIF